jgi:transcriptional regulator with XRE-family HTH domain
VGRRIDKHTTILRLRLGAYIRAERHRKEIGLNEFAERCDVIRGAVTAWERGVTFPAIDRLPKIADALGVSLFEILHVIYGALLERPRKAA